MRRQLLIITALAVLGAAIAAAVASASSLLQTGSNGVQITLPGGQQLPPIGALPQCTNLKDDDGDGLVDLADPDCSGPLDQSEAGPPPPPDDGGGSSSGGGGSSSGGGGTVGGGGNTGGGGTTGTGGTVGGGGQGSGTPGQTSGGNGGVGPAQGGRGHSSQSSGDESSPLPQRPDRKPDGVPTNSNPSLTVTNFGPAPLGVPDFVISQFTIPPFLLPIYQACGTQYGIPWEVLAGINRIETAFGTNLNVSTSGAVGWMQFLPSTWKAYGVDANSDGRADPYNPVDAICAAARYLRAAGGNSDIRRAIFAYNHADWYVDEVLLYARQYGRLPEDLVGSLTGLTEGDRFPIAAPSRYADDIAERQAAKRAKPRQGVKGNVADVISSSPTRRGINIYSRRNAAVVAVNDGTIKRIGHSKKLGRYVVLADAYGNRFTYAQLGSLSKLYPVPKQHSVSAGDFKLVKPGSDTAPKAPASAGLNSSKTKAPTKGTAKKAAKPAVVRRAPRNTEDLRRRLFALPERSHNVDRAGLSGQLDDMSTKGASAKSLASYRGSVLRYDRRTMTLKPLRKGSRVVAGTVIGRVGGGGTLAPHLNFSIRPAGRGAPKIDPKPILDGWKLLEDTAIYRAAGRNPFSTTSVTQALLASKQQLERQVLADPRISIYSCGRDDISTGIIDRRILATMEYLADNGFRLTITALRCGHSKMTTSGYVSEHWYGDAMDIAQVNGIPIVGNQGKGTITEAVIKTLLRLQGSMRPHQIISLMNLGGPSFALADHYDHIHVGFAPQPGDIGYGSSGVKSSSPQVQALLKPGQWKKLIGRIAQIHNPKVPTKPSRFSLHTRKGASLGD
jgi:transglycosylase-like protein with SLT domain